MIADDVDDDDDATNGVTNYGFVVLIFIPLDLDFILNSLLLQLQPTAAFIARVSFKSTFEC